MDGRGGPALGTCSPRVLLDVGMQSHAVQLSSVGGPGGVLNTNRGAQSIDLKGKLAQRWVRQRWGTQRERDSQQVPPGPVGDLFIAREICPLQEMSLFTVR